MVSKACKRQWEKERQDMIKALTKNKAEADRIEREVVKDMKHWNRGSRLR